MNPVKSGNRAISVQTKGQPLAIVAAATQAPKVMMPTEISSETTLSMVGCSSRLCRPPSGKIAQPGERNGTLVYLGHHLRLGGDYHRIRGFIRSSVLGILSRRATSCDDGCRMNLIFLDRGCLDKDTNWNEAIAVSRITQNDQIGLLEPG
jgi:hypothetical protein